MGCEHEMAFAQQLAKVQAQTESNTDQRLIGVILPLNNQLH